MPLALFSHMVGEIVLVSDDKIASVIRLLVNTSRQVAEGAGTAPLAAAIQRRDELASENVGLILSGGNITVDQMTQIVRGETP